MRDHVKNLLKLSLIFGSYFTLYDHTRYVITNTKQETPLKKLMPYDTNFEAIREYSRTVLRYTDSGRDFITCYMGILKKIVDLHFNRQGFTYLSEHGVKVSREPLLVLKFEHLVIMQKSMFEGHPFKVLSAYMTGTRKADFNNFCLKTKTDYLDQYLIPIRNMVAHPTGADDYLGFEDWDLKFKNGKLALEIPITDSADLGEYSVRNLIFIANDIIANSIKIMSIISDFIQKEMFARYGFFSAGATAQSKYMQLSLSDSATKCNDDLITIDHNLFTLEFA